MEILSVKELVKQIRGVSYKPADLHDGPDGASVMLLRANNIDDGKINFDDVVYVDKKRVSPEQILQKGDVLICASSGSKSLVGKAATVDFDREVTFGAFCKVVRPKVVENSDYISMFFQSPIYRRKISEVAIGANINNIRNEHIDSLQIKWPLIEQRKKDVVILTIIDSIIRSRKEELRRMDELIKARFVEMFGSVKEEKLLGDISEFVTVGIANSATHAYAESGIPMLRNQNIKENHLDDSDLIYIKPEFAAQYESKKLRENDIIAMRTGYPGIACLVPKKYEGCQTFTTLIVRLKAGNNPRYVCSYINSDLGRRFIDSGKVGVAQQNFGAKSLAKMPIKIAPKEIQDKYAEFVAQVDKSKVVVQKALDKAQLLFDSLMQKYFG